MQEVELLLEDGGKIREDQLFAWTLWSRACETLSEETTSSAARSIFGESAIPSFRDEKARYETQGLDKEKVEAAKGSMTVGSMVQRVDAVMSLAKQSMNETCSLCGLHGAALCSPMVICGADGTWTLPEVSEDGKYAGSETTGLSVPGLDPEQLDQLQQMLRAGQTGSKAHDCCARWISGHRREKKQRLVGRANRELIEAVVFSGRGRTWTLGADRNGNTYWQFAGAQSSVYVQMVRGSLSSSAGLSAASSSSFTSASASEKWLRFDKAEDMQALVQYLDEGHPRDAHILRFLYLFYPEVAAPSSSACRSAMPSLLLLSLPCALSMSFCRPSHSPTCLPFPFPFWSSDSQELPCSGSRDLSSKRRRRQRRPE